MFNVGDIVYLEDSSQIDIGFLAWEFVKAQRRAVVRHRMEGLPIEEMVPESQVLYAVEWDTEFSGGHSCQGNCASRRGQFVASKHLSLCFEDSREVVTVPNIKPQD